MNHSKRVIIFDLFGVLLFISKPRILRYLGIKNLARYLIRHKKTPFYACFEILEKMRLEVPGEYQEAMTYKDSYLPATISQWQKGKISNKQAMKNLHDFVDQLHTQGFFTSNFDYCIAKRTNEVMFDISCRAPAVRMNTKLLPILKKLKKAGSQLYILSNIDKELYEHICQKHAPVFELFDGVVTSFESQLIKPHKEIYTLLCNRYQINTKNAIFVDDQQDNILTGFSVGLRGILYHPMLNLEKELESFFRGS